MARTAPALVLVCLLVLLGCDGGQGGSSPPLPSPSPRPAPDVVRQGWTSSELVITYIGNAGFIVQSGENKIAIDALFQFDSCPGGTGALQPRLTDATAPFDDIDLVLATHDHGDHFDAAIVGRYLESHPATRLVAATTAAAGVLARYPGLQGRAAGYWPAYGTEERTVANGIEIDILFLPHGTRDYPNVGFVFGLGGYRLFHTGDTGGSTTAETLQILLDNQVPARGIDIAFPAFFYAAQTPPTIVQQGIPARLLVPMHFWCTDASLEAAIPVIEAQLPGAMVFRQPLQRLTLRPTTPTELR
jgi:L-ascorbate metabolism protein UlaG (beta-lactamase superfamily)